MLARGPVLIGALATWVTSPLAAQRPHAWQIHAVAAIADATFVGGGAGAVIRVGRRLGLMATFSAGALEGSFAGRTEGLALFRLNPFQRDGVGVYGGGGVALTGTEQALDERIVLLVGLEQAGASRTGWFAEAGIGGGVRLAAGLRVRFGGRVQ